MRYFAVLTIAVTILFSNISYSQPKATVQFIGGYSFPMGDLKGDFGSTFNTWTGGGNPDTNTYFMKSGVSYGICAKFPVKLKTPVNIIGSIGFNSFSNSAEYDDEGGQATMELNQRLFTFTLGGEFFLYSKGNRFMPFVGVEGMLSLFSGNLIIEQTETTEFTMNGASRFGLQFGGGVDYIFHNNLGISVGAKYAMANLFGKDWQADIGKKYNLGDGEHTINGSTYPEKKINYLTVYGGLSYYFGR